MPLARLSGDCPRHAWRAQLALLALALVVRFVAATTVFSHVAHYTGLNRSSDGYERIARNLLAGYGFRFKPDYAETTMRMPGYPYFLAAAFYVFGDRQWPVQLLQAACSAVTTLLLFRLAARHWGRQAGAVAALVWALYPGDVVLCARYVAEPLTILLLMIAVTLYGRLVRAPLAMNALWVGHFLALATMTKSSAFLVTAVFAAAIATNRGVWQPRRRGIVLLCAVLLPVSALGLPWAYRGYRLTDHWFFPTTLGGCGLMDGHFVTAGASDGKTVGERLYVARRHQAAVAAAHGIELDPTDDYAWTYKTSLGEYQMDRLQRQEWRGLVRADPSGFVQRSLLGLARFWYLGPTPRVTQLAALVHVPLLALAAIGLLRVWRRGGAELRLWLLLIGYYNVLNAVIDPLTRYAVTVIPFVSLLVGAAAARRGCASKELACTG